MRTKPIFPRMPVVIILLFLTCSTGLAFESNAVGSATLVFPKPDPALQRGLERIVNRPPFKKYVDRNDLSVVLVDVTQPARIRFAGIQADEMRYAASLPKIAVLLTAFDLIDRKRIRYSPQLKSQLEDMIRYSSNRAASDTIKLVGFENIARVLRDPRYRLYDPARKGGLWVGKDYGGSLGYWKRDPLHHLSHGATARQVARFLLMMEEGSLVSPWASREMKEIMSKPGIHHKFVKGLETNRPGSEIYRKSGTWKEWHADAALVERDGRKYIAVALLRSTSKGVLSRLIVGLDDLIFRPETISPALTPYDTTVAR